MLANLDFYPQIDNPEIKAAYAQITITLLVKRENNFETVSASLGNIPISD